MKTLTACIWLAAALVLTACAPNAKRTYRVAAGTDLILGFGWRSQITHAQGKILNAEFEKNDSKIVIQSGFLFIQKDSVSSWIAYPDIANGYRIEIGDDFSVLIDGKLATPTSEKKTPNQALQTTTRTVTPAASHPSRQRVSCLI
jgi:hypothetical protein